MLAAAIEVEVSDFIKQYGSLKTDEGELAVRGLKIAPKLAIGDGALRFWKAVAKLWPGNRPAALLGAQNR